MKEIELEGNKILRITYAENPESPNDWENTDVFLVYDHRQFNVTRKNFKPKYIYDYLDEKSGTILDHDLDLSTFNNFYIFTVYAYIHSGVTLTLGEKGGFDVSSSGYILVNKKELDFDIQRSNDKKCKDKTDEEIAKYYADSLITNWNTYLLGNVFSFEVIDRHKCLCCKNVTEVDTLDSCSGFYSEDGIDSPDLIVDMLSYIEYKLKTN